MHVTMVLTVTTEDLVDPNELAGTRILQIRGLILALIEWTHQRLERVVESLAGVDSARTLRGIRREQSRVTGRDMTRLA